MLITDEIMTKVLELALEGKTMIQMARAVGVSITTLVKWVDENPEFATAIKKAKELADEEVERSLRERAMGYSHKAIKFFCHEGIILSEEYVQHYPPDTAAAFIWLKNRQPHRWRDKPRDEELEQFKVMLAKMTLHELVAMVKPRIEELEAKKE